MSKVRRDWLRKLVRGRNRVVGLDRYADAASYFGPGGLAEAERLCAAANRDLLGFDPDRTATTRVGTPFPEENRLVGIDATVATAWKHRDENYRPIA